MKAVILAGGLGTRLSEETHLKPKPMVEIGGRPILWHIMKTYSYYGINDFIICCGYKGYVIKEFFSNYFLHTSDVTFETEGNVMKVHHRRAEDWKVTLVDTGEDTMTGGRLLRVRDYVLDDDTFCFTYGDGLSDIDISKTLAFHSEQGKLATVTAVYPPARFGALKIDGHQVTGFEEKPDGDGTMVNGGYFVLNSKVFSLIEADETVWETGPLATLVQMGELAAYKHGGFWQPMDTLRDKVFLEKLWQGKNAPWCKWK